jgi:hypothetical protein
MNTKVGKFSRADFLDLASNQN